MVVGVLGMVLNNRKWPRHTEKTLTEQRDRAASVDVLRAAPVGSGEDLLMGNGQSLAQKVDDDAPLVWAPIPQADRTADRGFL